MSHFAGEVHLIVLAGCQTYCGLTDGKKTVACNRSHNTFWFFWSASVHIVLEI